MSYLKQKNSRYSSQQSEKGFTLLELLIILGILAVLAAGAGIYLVNYQRGMVLETTAQEIVGQLRLARSKAINGEDGNKDANGDKWGIRFANPSGGMDDYYESFYGNSYSAANVQATTTLSWGAKFQTPAEGTSTDVIFTKITGTTSAANIIVSNPDGSQTKTITVDGSGRVSAN